MSPNMNNWYTLSAAIYYSGVGAVLIGTSIRYIYLFIERRRTDVKLLRELEDVDVKAHLGNIYIALQTIANELNIRLNLTSPTLQLEDSWILSGSLQKKK